MSWTVNRQRKIEYPFPVFMGWLSQEVFDDFAFLPSSSNFVTSSTGFRASAIRGVCWRVFLGVLPHDDTTLENWIRVLTHHRSQYNQLCERFLVDPHKQEDAGDLLVNNPLAQVYRCLFSVPVVSDS